MARAWRAGAGGITGLVELIERHGEALDADLQHHYRLSLADVVAGRLSLRRLRGLLRSLPGDGTAMWRDARRNADFTKPTTTGAPPPADWWTPERDLMATIIDGQNILAWQNTEDARKGRNAPKPIRRPGVTDPDAATYGSKPQTADAVMARLRPSGVGRDSGADEHGQEDHDDDQPDDADHEPGDRDAAPAPGPVGGLADSENGQDQPGDRQEAEAPQEPADKPGDSQG